VATLIWFNQCEKIGQQAGILAHQSSATAARAANPAWRECHLGDEFLQAAANRADSDASGAGNRRDATVSAGVCLDSGENTPAPFVQMRRQPREPLANRVGINHP
jgi:hypothetical protein